MAGKVEIEILAHDKASPVFRGLGGVLGGFGNVVGKVALGALTAGLVAASAAAVGFTSFLQDSVSSAIESQDALAQLNAVIESTGGVAGVSADMATELADSLQQVTRFSDETIIGGENLLLTFTNIGKDIFPEATQAMLDMSTALDQDVSTSAIQLGKALQDPILGMTALRRVGVNFTEEQQEMVKGLVESGNLLEAQKFILQELQTEFGGSAVAAGQTFAGKLEILNNQFDEVKERIGGKVIPILSMLIDNVLLPMLPHIEAAATAFADFLGALAADPAFQAFLLGVGQAVANVAATLAGLATGDINLMDILPPELIEGIVSGGERIKGVLNVFSDWWSVHGPGITASANTMLTAIQTGIAQLGEKINPFVDTVLTKFGTWFTANGPLIESFIAQIAQSFSEGLVPAVVAAWDVIQPLLLGLMDLILGVASLYMQIATGDWAAAWETIKSTAVTVVQSIWSSIVAFLNLIAVSMGGSLAGIRAQWSANWQQFLQILRSVFNIIVSEIRNRIDLAKSIIGNLAGAFSGISSAIRGVISWVNTLISKLLSIRLPKWLTPGSPTPFELGLRGIADAMGDVTSSAFPAFGGSANPLSAAGVAIASSGRGTAQVVIHLNYNPLFSSASRADIERIMPVIEDGVKRALKNLGK